MNQQDTQAPSSPAKKPRGVWGSGGDIFAGVRVKGRTVFLGKFPSTEAAAGRVQAAEALRDDRKLAGQPLRKSELLGRSIIDGEPDLLAAPSPAEREARRSTARQKRFVRSWRSMSDEEKASILQTLNLELQKDLEPRKVAA